MFTLAILGRPNVGKSTLFNRLTGTRNALVADTPGVTRDRREGKGHIGPLEFTVIDTAGLEQAREGTLAARMSAQSEQALALCDVALLVIDGRAGLTAEDRHFAALIRKSGKKVILAVNKCEGGKGSETLGEAFALGLGQPIAISAAHGEGLSDLYDELAPFGDQSPPEGENPFEEVLPEAEGEEFIAPVQVAIVGRPNAGKSTLFNSLLGYERTLTGPEAGITRDSIAVNLEIGGQQVKLIDTAGIRRRSHVVAELEKMAVGDSMHSVQYANVVILVLDAEFALEKQDLTLAGLVEKEGRAVVIALNKWDKVKDKQKYLADFHMRMEDVMPQLKGVAVQPICAQRGTHVDKLMEAVFRAYADWNRRVPTTKLNQWLDMALQRHSPPIMNGRRIKIRYITQIKTRPMTLAVFASKADKLPDSYIRYLVNSLREVFDLPGVPIRIQLMKNKNPYV